MFVGVISVWAFKEVQIFIPITTLYLMGSMILLLPSPAVLIPELQTSLLAQSPVHRTAVQTLPAIFSCGLHVSPSNLKARKLNSLLLSHRHGMSSILNSEGNPEARTRVQGRRISPGSQSGNKDKYEEPSRQHRNNIITHLFEYPPATGPKASPMSSSIGPVPRPVFSAKT
mgnify:FL=1|jgi:hypothetical protein